MLVKNQKNDKPCITCNNEPFTIMLVKLWKALNTIGLEVPSKRRWNDYGKESKLHFRTHAIMEKLRVGSSRNTFMTLS